VGRAIGERVHTIGRNQLLADLLAIAAHSGPATPAAPCRALVAWWGEARCARLFGDLVRPDGYTRWREDHRQLAFFLEYDTGSENLTQLAGKLTGYQALAAATGITTPVLFWLPSLRRETTARRALADALTHLDQPALVPVATSAADPAAAISTPEHTVAISPAAARWLPLSPRAAHAATGRVRLAALADLWPTRATHDRHSSLPDADVDAEHLPAPDPTPPPGGTHVTSLAVAWC
jgi:hypothetical protein